MIKALESCTDENRIEIDQAGTGELFDLNGYEITAIFATHQKIERDASFDYAGTHCTGGEPGTHHCTETEIEDIEIHGYEYAYPLNKDPEFFLIRQRRDIPRSRLEFYEGIVKDILERNL